MEAYQVQPVPQDLPRSAAPEQAAGAIQAEARLPQLDDDEGFHEAQPALKAPEQAA